MRLIVALIGITASWLALSQMPADIGKPELSWPVRGSG